MAKPKKKAEASAELKGEKFLRGGQVSRLICIANMLVGCPDGLTINEILDRVQDRGHEIEKRTIYRDLEALQTAGIPLIEDKDENGRNARWSIAGNVQITNYLVLNSRELFALYLSREALNPLRDTPFYQDLNSVFKKIEEKLGPQVQTHLNKELREEVRFEAGPRWGLGINPDILETIRAGCAERQVLEVEYRGAADSAPVRRILGPQYILFTSASLYLIAEDLKDHKVKTYAVPRFTSVEMKPDPYDGTRVEHEQLFQHSFGVFRGDAPIQVRLLASRNIAPYIKERQWHRSQRVVNRSEGKIEIAFELAVTPDFTQWIMGFGPEIEVLEPVSLRKRIAGSAAMTAELYSARRAA